MQPTSLLFLRVAFATVAIGMATLVMGMVLREGDPAWVPWLAFLGTLALAAATIAADLLIPRKPIDVISAVYFGLIVGVFLTYVVMLVLTLFLEHAFLFVIHQSMEGEKQ